MLDCSVSTTTFQNPWFYVHILHLIPGILLRFCINDKVNEIFKVAWFLSHGLGQKWSKINCLSIRNRTFRAVVKWTLSLSLKIYCGPTFENFPFWLSQERNETCLFYFSNICGIFNRDISLDKTIAKKSEKTLRKIICKERPF